MTVVAYAVAALLAVFSARRLLFLAAVGLRRASPPAPGELPAVTVIVPAHDEARAAGGLLAALSAIDYPRELLTFVLVCDGCQDATAGLFRGWARKRERAAVLELAQHGGKARALNAALSAARGEIVVVLDADLRPRPDVLRRLVPAFADPDVGAAAMLILPLNGCASLVARYAAVDSLVNQFATSAGKDRLGLNPSTFGAAGYRRAALESVGGFAATSSVEDVEVALALTRGGWSTRFVPEAIVENRVATTLRDFSCQKLRWTRGTLTARRRPQVESGVGLARRVETWMVRSGNADRVVFAASVLLAIAGAVPLWVPAAYLLCAALVVAAALARAGALRQLPRYLSALAVLFPVDVAVSLAAVASSAARPRPRWQSPRRLASARRSP